MYETGNVVMNNWTGNEEWNTGWRKEGMYWMNEWMDGWRNGTKKEEGGNGMN